MSVYTPDRWVLVDLKTPTETIRKVFAGWYGGYCGSDVWKLSSEVVSVTDHVDRYEFLNHSGSTYICYKQSVGMSSYMLSVYSNWKDKEDDKVTMQVVAENDIHAITRST